MKINGIAGSMDLPDEPVQWKTVVPSCRSDGMEQAIDITEQELKWHNGHCLNTPGELAFIAGMKHLLELFKQASNINRRER